VHEPGDRYADEAEWQDAAGYARAARRGTRIVTSGTTASGADGGVLHPGDTHGQTAEAITRALRGVEALGGSAADVLRTRLYLEAFDAVRPANTTLFVAGLVGEGLLVEVELDAELRS
jgi:enamine deaminase RidA (YjgF/YER057c/UK114 family)